jgi:hypothetical protein
VRGVSGRVDDVGEQHGGQNPVEWDRGETSGEELLDPVEQLAAVG